MVDEIEFVNKFNNIYKEINRHEGTVYLFMVLKMDELVDRWTVLLSTSWITSDNRNQIFNEMVNLFKQYLTEEELSVIARIGILPNNYPLVNLITRQFKVSDENPLRIRETKINGNDIHDAWIFYSRTPDDSPSSSAEL